MFPSGLQGLGELQAPLACLNGGDCTAEMLGWGADQRRILEEYEFAGKCGITGSPWLQASVYQNGIPWVVPVQWLRRPVKVPTLGEGLEGGLWELRPLPCLSGSPRADVLGWGNSL